MNYKNILKKVGEKVGRCITFRDLTCGGSTSTDLGLVKNGLVMGVVFSAVK